MIIRNGVTLKEIEAKMKVREQDYYDGGEMIVSGKKESAEVIKNERENVLMDVIIFRECQKRSFVSCFEIT